MLKFLVIMTTTLFLACASGEDATTQDYTQGMPTENQGNNNTMTPPPSGNDGQGQTPNYPECVTTANCFANEICDPSTALCIESGSMGQGPSVDSGVGAPNNMDMSASNPGTPPTTSNGCASTPDVQIFQTAAVCTDGCEEVYQTENQQCQQTPSRLADCLGAAAQARNECNGNCPDLSRSMTACLSVCLNDGNVGNCGRGCFAQAFNLTATCHECFAGVFECGANFCQALCVDDTSDECGNCLESSCGQAFEQCAGLALP